MPELVPVSDALILLCRQRLWGEARETEGERGGEGDLNASACTGRKAGCRSHCRSLLSISAITVRSCMHARERHCHYHRPREEMTYVRIVESPLAKCILKKAASPARYGRSERCAEARDAVRPSWLPSRYDNAGRLRSPAASGVPFACVRRRLVAALISGSRRV